MENKICGKCKISFPATTEYFYKHKSGKYGLQSECKKCASIRSKAYQQSPKGREIHNLANRMYRKTENGKKIMYEYQQLEKVKAYKKRWQQSDRGKAIQLKDTRKYLSTEKGKQWINRMNHKRREMGYIELIPNPFDDSEKIEWHHIDDSAYVVAVPYDLHRLYYGKHHKENLMMIIKQIYPYE